MKQIFTFLLSLGISAISLAQTGSQDAKKVLDGVSEKFKTFKTVNASFSYKVENAAGKNLSTKKGTVWMKGTKYRVSFSGQEIFCDGKTVWNYDKAANEVTISSLDASGSTLSPQKLFTNFYDKDFTYFLKGEKKEGGKTLQEIEMTPTDKSKAFSKVNVMVDKTAKTIYSTKVTEKAGSKYSYTVTTMKSNATIADSQFVFDKKKYPGVEEVDLR
ncbi:MAG: outer membrane lipoprotein carrier protein LolA [Bacteroidetes bacterium]|nr:MAG: outer membrane lipoprotein carrier protein LolA [Bacteroidota bacterium]